MLLCGLGITERVELLPVSLEYLSLESGTEFRNLTADGDLD